MHVPAALVALVLVGIGVLVYLRARRRPAGLPTAAIERLDGAALEQYLAELFTRLGFDVQLLAGRNEFGADLIVGRNGATFAVQADARKRDCGISAVQQALGARFFYGTREALVVTNRVFSTPAKHLAAKADVVLWERDDLLAAARAAAAGRAA